MAINTYSLQRDGSELLTENFKVREFRCYDGSDRILVDTELVEILQRVRDHFRTPVTITSGYRTESHNENVGGASSSYHLRGMAADFQVQGVSPLKAALYLERVMEKGGLGCYSYASGGFVHVDTRDYKSRWVQAQSSGSYDTAGNLMPMISLGSRGEAVKIAQRKLGELTVDGIFGQNTLAAVRAFQKEQDLSADGIIGPDTWGALGDK